MDKRVQKTKNSIYHAYISLLIEKNSHRISVTELAQRANIDRKTFYLHYDTVDDVMRDFSRQLLDRFMRSLREQGFFRQPFDTVCFYQAFNPIILEHIDFFRHISAVHGYNIFWEQSKENMTRAMMRMYQDKTSLSQEALCLHIRFLLAGVMETYRAWLQGELALPLEELGRLTNDAASHCFRHILTEHTERSTGMRYTLAIFDLDGTILNTLDDLADSARYALRTNGLPERTTEEVRRFVGNGIRKLIARAVPEGTSDAVQEQVYQTFIRHYMAHCSDKTAPYPGITALLRALRAAGCRTAVVSNKADQAVQALCRQYFPGLFDAVAGERDGVRRKPAPDAVLAVLDTLGMEASQAVYIGDSDVDIRTAENAGLDAVIVDWGFRDREWLAAQGAPVIVSEPDALRQIILGEQAG